MNRRYSRLSEEQTRHLLECFVAGMPARPAAELAGVNRNTARLCFHHVRQAIALHLGSAEPWSAEPAGAGRADVPARRGLVAARLLRPRREGDARVVPLAGLLERSGRVQVVEVEPVVVADPCTALHVPAPAAGVLGPGCGPADLAQADGADLAGAVVQGLWVDAIVCVDDAGPGSTTAPGRERRMRLAMRDDVAGVPQRQRALREFWRLSAGLLRRYNGVPRRHAFLYLKECEWRYSDGMHEADLATLVVWFSRRAPAGPA
ncbi:MAG: hypothetical protein RLZZ584_880 [Pseudomonadota bacterium]|jgi:transposase